MRPMAGRCRWHWLAISLRQVVVLVPAAVEELDEAHAALDETAGQEAVGGVGARLADLGAVESNVARARSRGRSARARTLASGTPSRTARSACEISGSPMLVELHLVELRQVVEHAPARLASSSPAGSTGTAPGRRRERNFTPWYCVGRKPLPHRRSYQRLVVRAGALRDHHHERGQVLVLAAQTVGYPRADLGRPASCEPVWKKVMAGSWLIASVCIDRISADCRPSLAVCGNNSLNHMPAFPVLGELEHGGAVGNVDCRPSCP